jgi:glycosyltransferase involved in cell wall biosynthesis
MKILFIGTLPEPVTGQSLACQVLLDELRKRHEVEVINLSKAEFRQGVSSLARVRQICGVLWSVWRKRGACDAIYLTTSESLAGNLKDLLIYLLCWRRLPALAAHLHGGAGMREIMLGGRRTLRALNAFFVRRLGAMIVLGKRHVDLFAGVMAPERIRIVPNFAQDAFFTSPQDIDRKFARTEPLRLLFLSNLLPGKGHLELLEACLSLSPQQRARVELDFAGGFESPQQQQDFLRRMQGSPQVRYHGVVHGEEKRRLFAAAHVFCLPTYYPYEGQPISILEAYASGCAVITNDHSGIFDIFTPGVNGHGVVKRSVESLRSAIEQSLAQPQILHGMARTNHELALRSYRTTRFTDDVIAIIARLPETAAAGTAPAGRASAVGCGRADTTGSDSHDR